MLAPTSLWQLVDLDRPDLKVEPLTPAIPPRLLPPDEDEPTDIFAAMQAGDILVHHPYESFAASVERLVEQAADDPDVLTIKQTLYRTSLDSRVVNHLIRAAEQGNGFLELVDREIAHATAGRSSGIVLKMNALLDRACVEALYRASAAGV